MLNVKRMFKAQVVCVGLLALGLLSPSFAGYKDHKRLAVDKVKGDLSVMVLGSGGPVATTAGRASAGYLIFTDGSPRILMDVGGGTFQRLAESGADIKDLDIVLLSHLHIDHTGDLSSMIKTIYFHNRNAHTTRLATKPVRIFGPAANGIGFPFAPAIPQYPDTSEYADGFYALDGGVERYLNLFATAITLDNTDTGPSKFKYEATDLPSDMSLPSVTVVDEGLGDERLLITAIAVDHGPVPAVAYRVDYKGHSIVYSGDTGTLGGKANMVEISDNADLLIYDTAVTNDEPAYGLFHVLHTNPSRMGEVASSANVKTLLLSHITPVTEPRLNIVKAEVKAAGYTGKIKAAKDLKVFNLDGRPHH